MSSTKSEIEFSPISPVQDSKERFVKMIHRRVRKTVGYRVDAGRDERIAAVIACRIDNRSIFPIDRAFLQLYIDMHTGFELPDGNYDNREWAWDIFFNRYQHLGIVR